MRVTNTVKVFVVKSEQMGWYQSEVEYVGFNRQKAFEEKKRINFARSDSYNCWVDEFDCKNFRDAHKFIKTLDRKYTLN